MGPKVKAAPKCGVCKDKEAKYRCPNCVVRYCSVDCFRKHKAEKHANAPEPPLAQSTASTTAKTSTPIIPANASNAPTPADAAPAPPAPAPLKPLTSLKWPPEPDSSIFTDPLRREDPKPLCHEELLRIATSPDLRQLLSTTSLPGILRLLDRLPTPAIRSMALSRCLGLDDGSLSRPGETLITGRDSPPPLDTLLEALVRQGQGSAPDSSGEQGEGEGWWLHLPDGSERIWIGPEERRVMRLWAGVVCQAIDGSAGDAGGAGWGSGNLAWEV